MLVESLLTGPLPVVAMEGNTEKYASPPKWYVPFLLRASQRASPDFKGAGSEIFPCPQKEKKQIY